MAKKSQTNARRNNTQAGRRVVNFYNNGTINIDARQNRSRTNKTENNGCAINYPCNTSRNLIGDYFTPPYQSQPATYTDVINTPTPKQKEDRKPVSRNLIIAAGIATATIVAGLSYVAIKYFN